MPTYSHAGLAPTSLPEYVGQLTTAFRNVLGDDMSTEAEAPQTQLIGALALELARIDEAVIYAASGMSLWQATGRQLDDWGTLLAFTRLPATHSTVVLTLAGTPGAIIPANSRVRNNEGAIFATDQDVVVLPTGFVNANATAVDAGPVHAAAGSLTTLLDVVAGWSGASNPQAAVAGQSVESDVDYRRRYTATTSVHARDSRDAIRSRLLNTAGVTHALVRDNPTDAAVTVQGVSIPARAVLAVVLGGTDAAVAEAISRVKPVGIPTAGTTTETNVPPNGNSISFTRVNETPVRVAIGIHAESGFPSDGISQIQQRVADWSIGEWSSGPGDFHTTGVEVGQGISTFHVSVPAGSVPGVIVDTVVLVDVAMGNPLPAATPLTTLYTIDPANVTVAIAP